jgi:hypothetical protein
LTVTIAVSIASLQHKCRWIDGAREKFCRVNDKNNTKEGDKAKILLVFPIARLRQKSLAAFANRRRVLCDLLWPSHLKVPHIPRNGFNSKKSCFLDGGDCEREGESTVRTEKILRQHVLEARRRETKDGVLLRRTATTTNRTIWSRRSRIFNTGGSGDLCWHPHPQLRCNICTIHFDHISDFLTVQCLHRKDYICLAFMCYGQKMAYVFSLQILMPSCHYLWGGNESFWISTGSM